MLGIIPLAGPRTDLALNRAKCVRRIAALAAGLLPGGAALAQSQSSEVTEKCKRAAVMILTASSNQQEGDTPFGSGSGYFINRTGLCITNNHVVDPGHHKSQREKFQIKTQMGRLVWEVVVESGTDNEKVYKADVLYQNEMADLALMQVKDENGGFLQWPDYLKFVPGRRLQLGQKAWCYGFPGGDSRRTDQGKHPKVAITEGHLVGLPRRPDGDLRMIETDVLANPGNSGGPFADIDGNLIGTLTLGAQTKSRTNTTFLIPADLTMEFITTAFQRGKMASNIDLEPFYTQMVGLDGYVYVPGVNRAPSTDCIVYDSGQTVCGKPEGDSITLATPLGKMALPCAQIAYLLAKDDDEGIVLMDGGQRLPFLRGETVTRFHPEGGKVMEQALDEVKAVAFRKGNKLPPPPAKKSVLIGGDDYHLLLYDVSGEVKFSGEQGGTVSMPLERIAQIRTEDDERTVYTVEGSQLKGEFAPHAIKATLAINGSPQTLSLAEVKNATIDVVDYSKLSRRRSLKELFKDASPELQQTAAVLESDDVSGAKKTLSGLLGADTFNKLGALKKDQVRLLNAVTKWRTAEYGEAVKELKKLKRADDEDIRWYAQAIAAVLEKHPSGKYNDQPLSDVKVFRQAGGEMISTVVKTAKDLISERKSPRPEERGEFLKMRKRFDESGDDLMRAGWLGSEAADDLLVRIWNFQSDVLESEIFRLHEEIGKKNEEMEKLQPNEQEFKGRKIQEQIRGLTRDQEATVKWRVDLAERMQTFGFIIDDPDLELTEKQ